MIGADLLVNNMSTKEDHFDGACNLIMLKTSVVSYENEPKSSVSFGGGGFASQGGHSNSFGGSGFASQGGHSNSFWGGSFVCHGGH